MANRSHIYTCDDSPGADNFYARGLSEYNWDVPLAHKLMMAQSPRIVRSAIWNHDIGILADQAGAFERVIAVFEKLGSGTLADRDDFDRELSEMKTFLADTPPSRYVLMEAGEILDLSGGDLNEEVQRLLEDIVAVGARADRALAGSEDAWLDQLRGNWQENARPGWWSEVLYYSFKKPE